MNIHITLKVLLEIIFFCQKSSSPTGSKEKNKVVETTVNIRKKIIAYYENGLRVMDLANQYHMARSTIPTAFVIV